MFFCTIWLHLTRRKMMLQLGPPNAGKYLKEGLLLSFQNLQHVFNNYLRCFCCEFHFCCERASRRRRRHQVHSSWLHGSSFRLTAAWSHAEEAEKKEELCMYFMVTFNVLLLNFLKISKIAGDFWLLTEDLRKIFRRWPVPSIYRSFRTLSKAFQIAVEDPLMFRPYNMYIWSLLNQFIASSLYS